MAEEQPAEGMPAGLTNRISGERYVFREDAGDGVLRWETYIAQTGDGPPVHLHPRQEERFLVRSGAMGARVGGRQTTLREGEELVVPSGTPHKVWNVGRGELHATVEMRPAAARFRAFLEAGAELPRGGLLGALEGARLIHEYRDVILPASPPEPVRRLIFPALASLARLVRIPERLRTGRSRSPGQAQEPARTYRLTTARRLVNRAMAAGLRFGVAPKATYLLTTRGRTSGEPRTTPVTLVEESAGGRRWLVAPYGEVNWVRNARASGRVTLSRGRRSETVIIEELDPQGAAPVLKEYAKRVSIVRPYFDADPDSPVKAFAAEAHRHPVFRLTNPAPTDGSET